MFKRFRRSMIGGIPGSRGEGESHQVCHECGQSLRNTINTSYAEDINAGQFDPDPVEKHDSWNGSISSDSGYGSSRHSELEARLDLSDEHPIPPITLALPRRRPTYNSSIYSENSSFEHTPQHQIIMEEPAQVGEPVYDHLFDLPPRTYTNYSDKWKPKSRYSRLNELPAASPTAMSFPDDVMTVEAEAEAETEKEPTSPEKKRRSMVLRPGSLRRLTSRRLRSQ